MREMIETMQLPYAVLPPALDDAIQCLNEASAHLERGPFVLLTKSNTFSKYAAPSNASRFECTREAAIEQLVALLQPRDVVVSTTGFSSRELYEIRQRQHDGVCRDFLTVGSMGHASSIALGMAHAMLNRQVFCFDGDGMRAAVRSLSAQVRC